MEGRIIETIAIEWQGITIEVRYEPEWLRAIPDTYRIAHLEVIARRPDRAPLPITETGYKSHFLHCEEVEAEGGAAAFVFAWLDHAAKSPAWTEYLAQSRQLDLF